MDIVLPLDFKGFLKLLNDKEVEYLLIGGYAVAYHGYPRATNDIDVWVAINPQSQSPQSEQAGKWAFQRF